MKTTFYFFFVLVTISNSTAQTPLLELYTDLHRHPELSMQEERTAAIMAKELRAAGFAVTERVGAHNVVGVLENGDGPTVMVRTDMDALPLEEKTGLPYASLNHGVMHACGHDVHMSVFIGAARYFASHREDWKGTLVFLAQSAEETGFGADLALKNGLYERFPLPDAVLGVHMNGFLPAGSLGYKEGAFMASVDMMDITVFGVGGHGAAPHQSIDPIVLSAQMILAFQTVVSRETNPLEPAVLTVGSIHGGTVHNIIPDEVRMQLTLRSYSDEVRLNTRASIRRIAENMARAAGLPEDKMPVFSLREPQIPATLNDVDLTRQVVTRFNTRFGEANVVEMPPYMVGEDFSFFSRTEHQIPATMFWLGAADPGVKPEDRVGLHSPFFAPKADLAIKTGVSAMVDAVMGVLVGW